MIKKTPVRKTTSGLWKVMAGVLFFLSMHLSVEAADVEWRSLNTLKLASPPLDMVISRDGGKIFVLTEQGEVHIYRPDGHLTDTIHVGDHVDQILAGPREDILVVKSRSRQTVEILVLDFIRDIDIEGSPVKGNAEAPVTIAVFSDYQ